MTAIVGLVCCPKDCCDLALQNAPEYIDVTMTKTVLTVGKACNQPPFGPWVNGQIVLEGSTAWTIKTRLQKVLTEGVWRYECPAIDDPNWIHSATISSSQTNYLACFDLETGGVWYGETYNRTTLGSFVDQPGCALFSFTLNGTVEGCKACFSVIAQFPAGTVENAFTCGGCQFPNLDSGSEFNEDSLTIQVSGMCRDFVNSTDFVGDLISTNGPDSCPCPQDCPNCVLPNYPGILTCSAFGEQIGFIDVALCVSTTYDGFIEEVLSPL